jgi:hypothetical protein
MAKKQQKKTWPHKKIVKRVLLVLPALLVGYLIVHYFQIEATYRADKVRFIETDKDMDIAYKAIIAKLGKPYETYKSKSCSYGSAKFSHGALSCDIRYAFSYATSSTSENKAIGEQALKIMDEQDSFHKWDFGYERSLGNTNGDISYRSLYRHGEKISCGLEHQIFSKDTYSFEFGSDKQDKDITEPYYSTFALSCGRILPKAVYSVSND